MRNQINVWRNVRLPANALIYRYAQAAVSDEEMERARQLTWQEARDVATQQIQKAKDFLKNEAGYTHWLNASLPQYAHWQPFKEVIDNAESNFELGEKEGDFNRKREYYILAWRTGRIAVDRIAEEVRKNRSDWAVLLEPVTTKVKAAYDEAKREIKDTTETTFKVVIGLAILFVILRAQK